MMQEEEMLYQALRFKFWLERIQKDEWIEVVPKEMLKRLIAEMDMLIEQAKHGKGDSIVFFNTFFSALDDVVLCGIYRVNRHMDRVEEMLNSESEVTEFTKQELEIYKKRFGEIPREEIDKELFGIDDEKGDKTDDLPF